MESLRKSLPEVSDLTLATGTEFETVIPLLNGIMTTRPINSLKADKLGRENV